MPRRHVLTVAAGFRSGRLTILSVLAVLSCLVLSVSIAYASVPAAGDATRGRAIFQANCAGCHGPNAAGGLKVGDQTTPDVRWSALAANFKDLTILKRAILTGEDEEGEPLDTEMPRFDKKLTDAQVDDIIAFLQTAPATALPASGEPSRSLVLVTLAALGGILALGGLRLRRAVH